ncbi:hypothetical protein J2W89_003794 [Pseudarthrobacter oxydans]|nr:hypothetical protein [Pseudarthrobacter oxydans]
MTLSESDGVDDFVEQSFQHALAMAAQIGSAAARTWKQHSEQARADNSRRGSMARLAFDSERLAAVTSLAPTARNQWWESAWQADIVDAYRIATAWKDHDPAAAAAEENIRTQLQQRFGFDINELVKDQQRIDAAHDRDAALETWMELAPAERSTAQAPEAVQAAAERWAITTQSPDYQDHIVGQAQANSPEAKDQLVRDWLAAGASQIHRYDPEYLAARKRFEEREPARNEEREREAEQRRQEFLTRQGRNPEQAAAQLNTAGSTEARKDAEGYKAVAVAEYARADQAKDEAAREQRTGPTALEEEWYREEFLHRDPDAVESDVKAQTAAHDAGAHERAGNTASDRAAAAYGTAEHRAALEEQLVSAGVPDQAVRARMQGEKIQKYPITHAAAGKGAKAGKTRAPSATKTQAQSKNRTRGR